MVSFRKIFFKIKFLFKMRIRIRIMILLWISIPGLHFIHRRHPPNFVLTPLKVIVSTWKVHVRTYRKTDRPTEIFFCLFRLLRYTKHEHSSKGENFSFFTHAITILSLFTYSVCDEKVKRTCSRARSHSSSHLQTITRNSEKYKSE